MGYNQAVARSHRSAEEVAPGVHRFCDGLANWYAIAHDGGVVLVDSGWPRSRDVLVAGLRDLGWGVDDVRALLLTHGHVDHVGSAAWLEREHGIPVYAHRDEIERALGQRPDTRSPRMLLDVWRPSAIAFIAGAFQRGLRSPEWPSRVRPIAEAPVPGDLRVIETPGHTEGHVAYHLADRGVVLSGDSLVMRSVLTGRRGPQLHPAAFTVDVDRARQSLRTLAAVDADLLLPGHGEPWADGVAEAADRARAV